MKIKSRVVDSPITVFFIFLIIFLLTLTSNFTAPHDSMAYLEMLRTKNHLWHPHHLLYHQLAYYWLQLLKPVFPGVQDYFLVESFSSLFGAGTVALVYVFFRKRFQLPIATSWISTGIVAFSYGVWFYSVNVEVYAPSIFFTIACLYQLTRMEWNARSVWITAILHSMAILFHQMNILLIPVVIYKIFEQRRKIFVLKGLFWYAITGILLVGGVYFLAGRFGEGHTSWKSWITWVEGYTTTDDYWRTLTWKTPLMAATGFAHAILGGHFVFTMGLENWITSLLNAHTLDDEFFLVRNMSQGFGRFLFLLSLLLGALTIFLLFRFLSRIRTITQNYYYITLPLILYFTFYSFYFLFWVPEILEFWIGQSIVFWLLIIGFYQPVNLRMNFMLGTMLFIVGFINYAGSISPMQDINNDAGYVRIQQVKELSTQNDLILVQNPWLLKEFLQYYTHAAIAHPKDDYQKDSLLQQVRNKLETGNKVFVFINRKESYEYSNPAFLNALIEQYKTRAALLQEKPAEVWVLK